MSDINILDRAAGAVMGAFIGDAMGLGPHCYYDLAEMRSDYGDWISDYTDPKLGRYHAGLKAGQLSQSGFILKLSPCCVSISPVWVKAKGISLQRPFPPR